MRVFVNSRLSSAHAGKSRCDVTDQTIPGSGPLLLSSLEVGIATLTLLVITLQTSSHNFLVVLDYIANVGSHPLTHHVNKM